MDQLTVVAPPVATTHTCGRGQEVAATEASEIFYMQSAGMPVATEGRYRGAELGGRGSGTLLYEQPRATAALEERTGMFQSKTDVLDPVSSSY